MTVQELAATQPQEEVLMRDDEWPALVHGVHAICEASDMVWDAAKAMAATFDAQGTPWTDEQRKRWEAMSKRADLISSAARFMVEKIDFAYHRMTVIDTNPSPVLDDAVRAAEAEALAFARKWEVLGVIVRIDRTSPEPFAMGNHVAKVEAWAKRDSE